MQSANDAVSVMRVDPKTQMGGDGFIKPVY